MDSDQSVWHSHVLNKKDLINAGQPLIVLHMQLLHILDKNDEMINIRDLQIKKTDVSSFSLPEAYEWKVNKDMIEAIKTATPTTGFYSDPFKINGIDFILSFHPKEKYNIDLTSIDGNTKCKLRLHLLKLPPFISAMTVIYTLRLKECNVSSTWIFHVDHGSNNDLLPYAWDEDCLSHETLMKLESITFGCDIHIVNASDKNGDDIQSVAGLQPLQENLVPVKLPDLQYFKWKIPAKNWFNDPIIANVIISEIFTLFGMKWYLRLIPKYWKGSDYIQYRIGIADSPFDIAEMSVYLKLSIEEIGVSKIHTILFNDCNMRYGLLHGAERTSFQQFDELTFHLEMILFGVYDESGNDVTKKCVEKFVDEKEDKIDDDEEDNQEFKYKWNIMDVSVTDMIESPFYVLEDDHNKIELKFEILMCNNIGNSEIYVCIKSIPENVKKISILCKFYIEELQVNIGGVLHFTKDTLKVLFIDTISLSMDYSVLTTLIDMKYVSCHTV